MTIDIAQIRLLTEVFVDIVAAKIPAFYKQYGSGSQVTWNVINMWKAALDCAERAAELSAGDPLTQQAFERRAVIVRGYIEDAEIELGAWIEAEAMAVAEGEHAVKH